MNKIGCPLYMITGFLYFIFSYPIIMTWNGGMPLKFVFPDIFATVGNKRALVIWVGQGFEDESMEVFFCILLVKNIMKDKGIRGLEHQLKIKILRSSPTLRL